MVNESLQTINYIHHSNAYVLKLEKFIFLKYHLKYCYGEQQSHKTNIQTNKTRNYKIPPTPLNSYIIAKQRNNGKKRKISQPSTPYIP